MYFLNLTIIQIFYLIKNTSALDKVLSKWVILAIFTHPFLIVYQIFSFRYPVLLMGANITDIWVFTPQI